MIAKRVAKKPLVQWDSDRLHEQLYCEYGPLVGGTALSRLLGYPSAAALRQAEVRNMLPVLVFGIDGRRGRFAFTEDVATWLAALRQTKSQHRERRSSQQDET